MATWREVVEAEPGFASRVGELFDAHRHKTIATIRADGSPRISGIESQFENGELVFGSMPLARKAADLRRDARFALHSATVDPVEGSAAQCSPHPWRRRRTVSGSGPTSPRSCTPDSTTQPRFSSLSGGRRYGVCS
jgi:hypothetical protein